MSGTFEISVDAKKLDVGKNATMSREDAIAATEEIIRTTAKTYPAVSTISASAVLLTEGAGHDPVQKTRMKMVLDNHVIVASAHSRSIKRSIERAASDLERQVRKLKEKKGGERKRTRQAYKKAANKVARDNRLDVDALLEKTID